MNTAQVMRSSAVMTAGTAMSRVLGFVRAAVLLAAMPPGKSGDAFSVANTIPNALYILLAGGVLNAVLVPQITRAAKMADGGKEYTDRLLTTAITTLFGLTVLVTLAAPLLIKIYATDNWTSAQVSLATAFALWCLPQVFWYGLYTLLGQVLNARGSFGPFMWAPVINNVVGIGGIIAFIMVAGTGNQPIDSWTPARIALLAGTATLGVVAQALILIPALRRAGIGFRPRWGLRGFGLRTAGRVAGWTFAAVLAQQLGFIIVSRVTTAAQTLAEQSNSTLGSGKVVYDTSFLLFMLPHSLIAVSLVTALFTRMSISAAAERLDEVVADLSLGLRLTGLATVLSAAAFIAIGSDLTRAMFPKNTPADTRAIAYVTIAMMIGLVPFSAQYLFQRVFYAFEDAKTPFLVQVPVVITWAVGNLLSLWLLPGGWVVVGVGASMTIGNLVGATLSLILLRRRFGRLDGRRVTGAYLKFVMAAVIAGVAAWLVSTAVHEVLGSSWPAAVAASALAGGSLAVIYLVVLHRLGTPELDQLLGPFLRRRGRGGDGSGGPGGSDGPGGPGGTGGPGGRPGGGSGAGSGKQMRIHARHRAA